MTCKMLRSQDIRNSSDRRRSCKEMIGQSETSRLRPRRSMVRVRSYRMVFKIAALTFFSVAASESLSWGLTVEETDNSSNVLEDCNFKAKGKVVKKSKGMKMHNRGRKPCLPKSQDPNEVTSSLSSYEASHSPSHFLSEGPTSAPPVDPTMEFPSEVPTIMESKSSEQISLSRPLLFLDDVDQPLSGLETVNVSEVPSAQPSGIPSQQSLFPSQKQSAPASATQLISVELSEEPSVEESSIPVDEPSLTPTFSSVPTKRGSREPSSEPSRPLRPREQHSSEPSSISSDEPSPTPTFSSAPSERWSIQPSKSLVPDEDSSAKSLSTASEKPSLVPTLTSVPSKMGSVEPSQSLVPSEEPSAEKSSIPSDEPSLVPTSMESKSDGRITLSQALLFLNIVDESASASETSNMSEAPSFSPLYINAGGVDFVDHNNITWIADDKFVNTGTIHVAKGSIYGTVDDKLYLSERYDKPGGEEMKFEIDVPNGEYDVSLSFSENYSGAQKIGGRVFNVSMEGEVTFSFLDIFVESGGSFQALTKTARVTVTDGALTIDFARIQENPKVAAIMVRESQALPDVPSREPSLQPSEEPSTYPSGPPTPRWIDMNENENYVARHECSFVQAGTKFYLFGGRESAGRIDTYDYASNTWSTSAKAPLSFNHFQATEYQGLVWVISAFKHNKYPNEAPAENIYVYDPANNVWMIGPEIPAARRRGGAGLVLYGEKFYIVGGNTIGHSGGFVSWFDEYNPHTNSWAILPNAPHERDHFHAAVVGDKMYAIGGRRTSQADVFGDTVKEVDVYDFSARGWLSTGLPDDLPSPRAASAVAVVDGNIMIMGGESGTQTTAYDEVNELDTKTGTWSTMPSMIHRRHGTQAIVSGLGVYVAGGSPVRGRGNQKNMEVYNEDAPSGVESVAGVLSAPSTADVFYGEQETISLQHVSGNQGVFVQSISLSGSSANDFTLELAGNMLTPLLIGKDSSLDILVEFTGTVNGAEASLDVTFSGSQVATVILVGWAVSEAPSLMPSLEPSTRGMSGPVFEPLYINAGGAVFTDSNGITWGADSYFKNGYKFVSSGSMNDNVDGELYLSERWGSQLSYEVPNIPNGNYRVTVHLSENYIQSSGGRVFNVTMEGNTVFPYVDIFAEAGAGFTAMTKTTTVTVLDGALNIGFVKILQNPKVSGIVVEMVQETSATREPSMVPSESIFPSMEPSLEPSKNGLEPSINGPAFEPIYINAGSDVSMDINEVTWAADTYFKNGYKFVASGSMSDNSDGGLYLSERWGSQLMYEIPDIPSGNYRVTLYLSENYVKSKGGRVFNVTMEGNTVFPFVDIFAEAGAGFTAVTKTATVTVLDGALNIGFVKILQNPKVSGISVESAVSTGQQGPTTESPSPSPSSMPSLRSTPSPIHLIIDAGAIGEDTSMVIGSTMRFGVTSSIAIDRTDTPQYFRTHRYGSSFTYILRGLVGGATYSVTLGFAEVYGPNCVIGRRIMVVSLNGNIVNPELDVYKEVGCSTAYIEKYSILATATGKIEIGMRATAQKAMLSFIQIDNL